MIEIRTFTGSAHSIALAIQNAETQANTYLEHTEGVVSIQTTVQTLPDLDGDTHWYLHIITVTIMTAQHPFQLPLDWVEVGANS